MDNAQKAIMIGVGLFITIIIISAVLLITNIGTNLINNSRTQLSSISSALQNQITAAYDGQVMTGADVIAACQLYENSEMSIVIMSGSKVANTGKYKLDSSKILTAKANGTTPPTTAAVPGGVYYTGTTYNDNYTKATLTELQASGQGANNLGISAVKTYYSSVIKDATTDTVVGVLFVQAQ